MFLDKLKKLGLKKQDRTTNSPAIVRNYFNKAINKAGLIALKAKKIQGAVTIWEGTSEFDGSPIKVVMSGYIKDSENEKTGPLVQVYILPSDETPREAYLSKSPSVCGDCIYNGGGCYVSWARLTPLWKASKKKHISLELASWLCSGLRIRLGAAGDPAAVPMYVWNELLKGADSWTGYTHAWRYCDPAFRRLVMASCDSDADTKEATSRGWNVFHVHDGKMSEDIEHVRCKAGQLTRGIPQSCFTCMMCHGVRSTKAKPLVIAEALHGATNTMNAARKARK